MHYYTYILCDDKRQTLYVGITNNLNRRLSEHLANYGNTKTFCGRYLIRNLLYYERHSRPWDAISREKEIKKWRRQKKLELVQTLNPNLQFLNNTI